MILIFFLFFDSDKSIKPLTLHLNRNIHGAGEGLIDLFSDIVELEMQCKFSDCLHETEPGCAVKKAIRDGTVSNKRLESYRKLQREIAAVERKKNPKIAEKKKWKDIKKWPKRLKKPGNEMIVLKINLFQCNRPSPHQ